MGWRTRNCHCPFGCCLSLQAALLKADGRLRIVSLVKSLSRPSLHVPILAHFLRRLPALIHCVGAKGFATSSSPKPTPQVSSIMLRIEGLVLDGRRDRASVADLRHQVALNLGFSLGRRCSDCKQRQQVQYIRPASRCGGRLLVDA